MKPLSSAWCQNLTGDAKADFEKVVRNSTKLLTRLQEIIEDRERSLHALNTSNDDFKDPSWSHKQAKRIGQLSELKQLKEIISLT